MVRSLRCDLFKYIELRWRSSGLFNEGSKIAMPDGYEDARIPSTKWINRSLEVKQKIVTAKFRVIQFGRKFGDGKHGCTAQQFRAKARELEVSSNESIDKFGISTSPAAPLSPAVTFHVQRILSSDSSHAGKGQGFSYPTIPATLAELRKDEQFSVFLKPDNRGSVAYSRVSNYFTIWRRCRQR